MTTTYRRVELRPDGSPEVVERTETRLGPGTVRVAVQWCSVNRADVERIRGSYGGIPVAQAAFASRETGAAVPGLEPVGTVVEVAEAAHDLLLGTRVLVHSHVSCGTCSACRNGRDNLCPTMRVLGARTPGLGGWSEQLVVPATQVMLLSDDVDPRGACTYEATYATVLHHLRHGLSISLASGPVLVRGVPGVLAVAALQTCATLGIPAAGVVRDESSPRLDLVRNRVPAIILLGGEDLEAKLADLWEDPPALVIEPLGGAFVGQDMAVVARGGCVGVLGGHLGAEAALRFDQLFHKGVAIFGTPRAPLHTMSEVAALVEGGLLDPLVDREFSLDQVADAVMYCDAQTGVGRVLLAMAVG